MFGVLDVELLTALLVAQDDRFVGEDRKAELSTLANQLDAVGAGTFVADEAPRAAARQAVGKLEGGTHGVLCFIKSSAVATEAHCPDDGTEDFLKQVYLVGGQIIEVAAACNVALHTPRQGCAVVVEVARRAGKAYLHGRDLTDCSALHQLLHLMEIWQVASVISHETWDVRLLADTVNALAVDIAAGQGFLHIDRFAGLHSHDGIGGMGGRRGCNIDGIHIRVADELLGIGVPTGNLVPLGIRRGFLLAAAHHRLYTRTRDKIKRRTALLFGHFTTSDEAPTYLLIIIHLYFRGSLVKEVPTDSQIDSHGVDRIVRYKECMAGASINMAHRDI